MESTPMLIHWQNQYYENDYITKSNLHVQHNPIKIPMTFITDTEKVNPKVHLEAQKDCKYQGQNRAKRAMLKLSQYLTSNYATDPEQ
jgi:hypothetical protein